MPINQFHGEDALLNEYAGSEQGVRRSHPTSIVLPLNKSNGDRRENRVPGVSKNNKDTQNDLKKSKNYQSGEIAFDFAFQDENEKHRACQRDSIASGNLAEDETETSGGETYFNKYWASASSTTRSIFSHQQRRRDTFGGFSVSSMPYSSTVSNSIELERMKTILANLQNANLDLENTNRDIKLELEDHKTINSTYEKQLTKLTNEISELKVKCVEKNTRIEELQREKKEMTHQLNHVGAWSEKRIRQIKKEMDMLLKLRRRDTSREKDDVNSKDQNNGEKGSQKEKKTSSGSLSSRSFGNCMSSIGECSYTNESNWSTSIADDHLIAPQTSSFTRADSKCEDNTDPCRSKAEHIDTVREKNTTMRYNYDSLSQDRNLNSLSSNTKKDKDIQPFDSKTLSDRQDITHTNKRIVAIEDREKNNPFFLDIIKLNSSNTFRELGQDEQGRIGMCHDSLTACMGDTTDQKNKFNKNANDSVLPTTLPDQWDIPNENYDSDGNENRANTLEDIPSTNLHNPFSTRAFATSIKENFFNDDDRNTECIETNWGEIQLKKRLQRSIEEQEMHQQIESNCSSSPNGNFSNPLLNIKQAVRHRLSSPFQQEKNEETNLSSGYSAKRHPPPTTLLKGSKSLNNSLGRRYSMVGRLNELRAKSLPAMRLEHPSNRSNSTNDNESKKGIMKRLPFGGGG